MSRNKPVRDGGVRSVFDDVLALVEEGIDGLLQSLDVLHIHDQMRRNLDLPSNAVQHLVIPPESPAVAARRAEPVFDLLDHRDPLRSCRLYSLSHTGAEYGSSSKGDTRRASPARFVRPSLLSMTLLRGGFFLRANVREATRSAASLAWRGGPG